MRKKFIAGNWKLYKNVSEAVAFAKDLKARVAGIDKVQIALAPPFTAIHAMAAELKGSNIEIAGQNCFWENEGAFTGEVGPAMLREAGATQVIIGHSERRQYFGETDASVNKKLKAALAAGLGVILCVGESLAEREAGKTFEVVSVQTRGGLDGLNEQQMQSVVLAYEPVWAIGTGRTASPAQAQEVHAALRKLLAELFGAQTADAIRIQYGGSVKPENVAELMAQPDIDGALVGGASLKADSFEKLVKF
ncbi:MAG: triose-phosphate isomerase [candidate division FCPU426 bacterium]